MHRLAWIAEFARHLSAQTGFPVRQSESIGQMWFGVMADMPAVHAATQWMIENGWATLPTPLPPQKRYVVPPGKGASAGTLDTVRQAFNRPVTKKR